MNGYVAGSPFRPSGTHSQPYWRGWMAGELPPFPLAKRVMGRTTRRRSWRLEQIQFGGAGLPKLWLRQMGSCPVPVDDDYTVVVKKIGGK